MKQILAGLVLGLLALILLPLWGVIMGLAILCHLLGLATDGDAYEL